MSRRLRSLGLVTVAPAVLLLSGCGERLQSSLHPAGSGASEINALWWLLLVVCTAVYLLVVALLGWAILRPRAGAAAAAPTRASHLLWLGLGGIALPAVVLSVFLFFTLRVMISQSAALAQADDLTVRVIGHRWWWEIIYPHDIPQRRVTTANEIYIPVGRTVRVELESRDIIHSFWVPALQGKIDMIPGRRNATTIHADRIGVFRGQCAEYCGLQHANMALVVVAVEEDQFERWYEHQLREAADPADPLAQEGQRVFLEQPCSVCHTVRGTLALGSVGPDLTHIASRRTLAAGTLPNTRGHLGGWISDPQSLKPGNMMPNVDLTAEQLLALLAYLETLE